MYYLIHFCTCKYAFLVTHVNIITRASVILFALEILLFQLQDALVHFLKESTKDQQICSYNRYTETIFKKCDSGSLIYSNYPMGLSFST